MDVRKKCIDENWPIRPFYDTNLYRLYYFYHDMDDILPRFEETPEEIYKRKKMALGQSKDLTEEERELHMKEIRDFLPYNTAQRIKEFVTFSVMMEGQAQELNITEYDAIRIRRLRYKMQKERLRQGEKLWKRELEIESDSEWEEVMEPHEEEELDFESIEILKNYKLEFYEKLIRKSVDRKYKISFFKGV